MMTRCDQATLTRLKTTPYYIVAQRKKGRDVFSFSQMKIIHMQPMSAYEMQLLDVLRLVHNDF